jgi:hypothetical protein
MKRLGLFIILLPMALYSQVADNFSDGDFTQNPSWTGDLGHFKVTSSTAIPEDQRPALQLNAPEAGQSALAVACAMAGDLEWQFWIKLSLNTSSGNFARVYLLSDSDSLKMPVNGYFIQFGGEEDSVDFYLQDSIEMVHLLRLNSMFTGNSTNALRFKVTRTQAGLWQFFGDPAGTSLVQPVGVVSDLAIPSGNHFGLFFQYTGSNTTKFYFDDVYAGPLIIDTIPPGIVSVSAVSPFEIAIIFNEPVEQESAENESNYNINPGPGHPYSAIRLLEPDEVHLFFNTELENGVNYELEIKNIKDINGNISGTIYREVMYYLSLPYDIIFTEIMADPTPPAGLPEFEYLEILNRSSVAINLVGWLLEIGSTKHEMPSIAIKSGEYFILCAEEAVGTLQAYGRSIGFSSFMLSNSGTSLQLSDQSDNLVCYLEYGPSWYREDLKSEGGYSLEITDTDHPCLDEVNWSASGHPDGGTPGGMNFNYGTITDDLRIEGICCVNESILEVSFSEAIDSISGSDISYYHIEPDFMKISDASPLSPDFRHVRLSLDQPGSSGQIYNLVVDPGLVNCTGEAYPEKMDADFSWPENCLPFDIVINEILFNPLGDGVDYVEIYNRSSRAILLSELKLASVRETPPNPPDTQLVDITSACKSLLPGQYLVLTRDPEKVRSQYFARNPQAFLEMPYFPYFNNDYGNVILFLNDTVIDCFHYNDEMHFLLLTSTEGVSLERICPDRLGDIPGNWHSAAETAGFGTPGYQNSQYLAAWNDESSLSLDPEIFSPDGDGLDDQLGVSYVFSEPGKLITVLIFSAEGLLAKVLMNNEMPGTSGIYTWDGTLDDRTAAPDGIYVVYMEILDMGGRTSHYKKACVLARRR